MKLRTKASLCLSILLVFFLGQAVSKPAPVFSTLLVEVLL